MFYNVCLDISCAQQHGGMVGWPAGMCYKCVCVLLEAARGSVVMCGTVWKFWGTMWQCVWKCGNVCDSVAVCVAVFVAMWQCVWHSVVMFVAVW